LTRIGDYKVTEKREERMEATQAFYAIDSNETQDTNEALVMPMLNNQEDFDQLKKAILRAQRCQRNWDLSRQLTDEQLNLILCAATQAPTKQNIPFYQVTAIQNRSIIESIYQNTYGEGPNGEGGHKNPQVLANTLLVFSDFDFREALTAARNPETAKKAEEFFAPENQKTLNDDRVQAIGVAAGFVNLTANMLGLRTGCCKCMDGQAIKEILGSKEYPRLLMGIGFPDETRPRRAHHVSNEIMNSYSKEIPFKIIQ
jgi:hypothetical protein